MRTREQQATSARRTGSGNDRAGGPIHGQPVNLAAGPNAGYNLLTSVAAALGQTARELNAPGQNHVIDATEQFAAMLDIVLGHLRDQVGFDIVWGTRNGHSPFAPGPADAGAVRCLLGPALADRGPAACSDAIVPLLPALATPLKGARFPAPILLTALDEQPHTAALAAEFGLRAILSVPIIPHQAEYVVGTLIAGTRDPAMGTLETLQLLGLLSGQLGTAIDSFMTMQRLRASEERAHLLTEGATDTIYMVDAEGRFTYLNPRIERLTGYTPRELLGQRFDVLLTPDSRTMAEEMIRRSVAGESLPEHYELEVRTRDGQVRAVEISATNLYEGDRFTGRFGIARDTTERRQLEDELAQRGHALEAKTAQLSQLLAVSAGFAANVVPEELLTTVARAIATALNFASVHVRMADATGAMIGVGFYGHTPEQQAALRRPTPAEFYDRLLDERFRIGEAYYIPHEVDRLQSFGDDWTVARTPAPADWVPGRWHPEDALVVPLRARDGKLIGVIYADEPLDGRVPDRAACDVLGLFARQASLAIENAGLYSQTQHDLRRQNALREVIEHISAELDFDRLLHSIIANAVELLGADVGTLGLVDESQGVTRVRAMHNVPDTLLYPEFRAGEGLLGLVLARREPVLADDYSQLPNPLPGVPYHSCFGVPIWDRDRIVGTFFVGAVDPARRFGPRDVETLELFAKHTALAIKNATLYSALEEQLSQVEGISAVGAALVEERNLERVLRTVAERVIALLGANGCSIALLDPDEATRTPNEELTLAVVLGQGAEMQGWRIPLNSSFSGEAIRKGEPVLSESAQYDSRGFGPTVRQAGINAVLSVPLQTSERTVGALNVHDPRDGRFGPRDIEIIILFAQQAAVAIENARLYEQARTLAVAEERNRMAREIHDTLAQGFTGIILQLEVAQSLLDGGQEAVRDRLLRAQDLARSSLQEARRSVWNLRPSPLQGRTLGEAIQVHLAEWNRATGLAAQSVVKGKSRPLPAEIEVTLLRIAQEALNNCYKHARATQIDVTLGFTRAAVTLHVCDNGVGFAATSRRDDGSGYGLIGMRERIGRIGGTLTVESTPGQGTCVKVRVRA